MHELDPQIVRAFYRAALFLKARIHNEGWGWASNYLREHVRVTTGMQFTNSDSPKYLRALLEQHPELQPLVKIKPLKAKPIGEYVEEIRRRHQLDFFAPKKGK
jgi:hypothetical protein